MAKYVIQFSKEGYICYISHLDLMRLFKRIFKRADIKLAYSQGFNPHPKLGFAQPLSLGYSSVAEYLEFETVQEYSLEQLEEKLQELVPEGVRILSCAENQYCKKTMAARTTAAEYVIGIPLPDGYAGDAELLKETFLAQKEIRTPKKQKKSKDIKLVDIRGKIQELKVLFVNNTFILNPILDCGSDSNLSPELLITAFKEFAKIETDRSEIGVMRTKLFFTNN